MSDCDDLEEESVSTTPFKQMECRIVQRRRNTCEGSPGKEMCSNYRVVGRGEEELPPLYFSTVEAATDSINKQLLFSKVQGHRFQRKSSSMSNNLSNSSSHNKRRIVPDPARLDCLRRYRENQLRREEFLQHLRRQEGR